MKQTQWAGGPELALGRRLDRMFSLKLHRDRWQRDCCHIILLPTSETETTKDKKLYINKHNVLHYLNMTVLASIIMKTEKFTPAL